MSDFNIEIINPQNNTIEIENSLTNTITNVDIILTDNTILEIVNTEKILPSDFPNTYPFTSIIGDVPYTRVSGLTENTQDIIGSSLSGISGINISYNDNSGFTTISLNDPIINTVDIIDFNSNVSGLLPVKNISGSGYVAISSTTGNYIVSVTGLQPSGNYAASSHNHASSGITDFNSSVSGLLPITSLVASTGIGITQSGTVFTIATTGTFGLSQSQVDARVNTLTSGIYAPLSSPSFIGTPLTPTASAGTNSTQIASTAFVRTEISNLVASAPTALDTLNELAAALGNDSNFATTVNTNIGTKASLSGAIFTGSISGPSGNFTSLSVNGTGVSISGHTHNASSIVGGTLSSNILPSFSSGKVAYVSKRSSATDTRTSLSPYDILKPFSTISTAASSTSEGDVIIIEPGSYDAFSISSSGLFTGNRSFICRPGVSLSIGLCNFNGSNKSLSILGFPSIIIDNLSEYADGICVLNNYSTLTLELGDMGDSWEGSHAMNISANTIFMHWKGVVSVDGDSSLIKMNTGGGSIKYEGFFNCHSLGEIHNNIGPGSFGILPISMVGWFGAHTNGAWTKTGNDPGFLITTSGAGGINLDIQGSLVSELYCEANGLGINISSTNASIDAIYHKKGSVNVSNIQSNSIASIGSGLNVNSSKIDYLVSSNNYIPFGAPASSGNVILGPDVIINNIDPLIGITQLQSTSDNTIKSYAIQRSNHTGTQTSSTISNFNTSVSGLLTPYQLALTNPVTGVGTSGYLTKWISNSGVGSGIIFDNGTNVGIGTTTPSGQLHVAGTGIFDNGIRLGSFSTSGTIIGLSTSGTVPAIIFDTVGNNHGNQQALYDFRENGTSFISIDGIGNLQANAGNIVSTATNPSADNGAFVGQGMRRRAPSAGIEFAWGESITSVSEPGIDLFPIGGTHISSGILFRLSKNSNKDNVALIVDGNGNIGIGTTNPTARLHVIGSGVFSSGIIVGDSSTNSYIYGPINPNINNIRFNNGGGDRIDFNSTQAFFNSSQTFFAGDSYLNRVGETTSTASQTNSRQLIFQNALWDGSAGQYFNNGIKSIASTSQNLTSRLAFFTHNGINNTQVERMCVTSSGGYVGIGTTTPTAQLQIVGTGLFSNGIGINTLTPSGFLDVAGDVYVRGTGNNLGTVYFKSTSASSDTSLKVRADTNGNLYLDAGSAFVRVGNQDGAVDIQSANQPVTLGQSYDGSNVNQQVRIRTAGTERIRVTNNGLVGIGTTTPSGQLHVNGTGIFNSGIYVSDITNQTYINGNNNVMDFFVGNNRGMRLSTYGTLAINRGTASALGTLHVQGNGSNPANTSDPIIITSSVGSGSIIRFTDSASNDWQIGVNPNGSVATGTGSGNFAITKIVSSSGLPYVTINSSGNVGINNTNPQYKLDVNGNTNISGVLSINGVSLGEIVDDEVAGLLIAGSGMSLTYNDSANTLTLDTSATTSLSGGNGVSLDYNSSSDTLVVNTVNFIHPFLLAGM